MYSLVFRFQNSRWFTTIKIQYSLIFSVMTATFFLTTRSSATRFRWIQNYYSEQDEWALDDIYIGQQCPQMCHGHGWCDHGHCRWIFAIDLYKWHWSNTNMKIDAATIVSPTDSHMLSFQVRWRLFWCELSALLLTVFQCALRLRVPRSTNSLMARGDWWRGGEPWPGLRCCIIWIFFVLRQGT